MGRETAVLELARAIEKYGTGAKHDLSSIALRTEYSHGPGGQLSWPGVDPVMFNAAMGPETILSQIPTKESVNTDPTYAILTGVQDDIGENKSAPCDDAPVAGLMKSCIQHSVFGRYEIATDQIELNRLGQRVDRADPLDLSLVGSAIGDAGIFGNANPASPADLLTSEVARVMWERNVAFFRILARQLIIGSPANNAAAGGYKELTGIQLLVNTGHVDAISGVACPAVDSYVRNFGYARIDADGGNTVAEVTNIWYQLRFRARRMGLMPVRWIIAMREQLFYAMTEIWPCAYSTYRCTTSAGNQATRRRDADGQHARRDAGGQLPPDRRPASGRGVRRRHPGDDSHDERIGCRGLFRKRHLLPPDVGCRRAFRAVPGILPVRQRGHPQGAQHGWAGDHRGRVPHVAAPDEPVLAVAVEDRAASRAAHAVPRRAATERGVLPGRARARRLPG